MMKDMIPKMMGGKMSMMDMMGFMMGGDTDDNNAETKPWDICSQMISHSNKSSIVGTFVTQEIQGMFEEWVQQIENEILDFLNEKSHTSIEKIAEHLKITKESVIYFISKLAKQNKIKLEVLKDDTKEQ